MNEDEYIEAANTNDAVEVEAEAEAQEVVTPEVKPEPAPAPAAPAPKVAPARKQKVVVSGQAKDDVLLSRCVFKNMYSRKSLTIHHVQRRLEELGYRDAGSDKDGWYGDLTKRAVAAFQKDSKMADTGVIDAATFEAIFADDPYVNVIID